MEAATMCRSLDLPAAELQPTADEDALLHRAQGGDAAALTQLIEEYRPRVYSFVLSQLRQREDAEDVTQETFVRMVRTVGSYQRRGHFRAWLYRIAANLCRDHARRRSRRQRTTIAGEDLPHDASAGDVQEQVSRAVVLAAAVSRLPDRYREVITLHWLEQLSPAEIAEILNRSVNVVRVQLWRGRGLLLRELGDWLD